ncbi:MAG: gluconate 5-dehydrogenase [Lachnospiraceae bacterium]|nr:gluconate 5-dehydrogenase [Lachnospiraceae bacterium]
MAGVLDKFKLTGKVAWITGASYGLGLAYAVAYAEAGAKVVFNDINQELVDRGLAEYKKLGIDVYGAVCDVTNEKQVVKFVSDVEKKVGPIDILVNNAGIIKRIPMTEMTLNEWNAVINVDLTGPFICSKAVIPSMIKRGGGKIINACSMMSELGRETVSAYAAAKGGLKMLTRNICSEYGQYNIQCNGIGPGYIATPQTAPLREIQEDGSLHPFDRFIRSKTPAQRWGETEDLMGLAVFLASPASDFINGQVVYIDGGILAYIGQDPSNLDASKFSKHKDKETLKKSAAKKTAAKKKTTAKSDTKKAPAAKTAVKKTAAKKSAKK